MALHLNEISKGRVARSIIEDPVAFWGAALIPKFGGLGILGEFLSSVISIASAARLVSNHGRAWMIQFGRVIMRRLR